MRKFFILCLTGFFLALSVTACGSNETPDSSGSAPAEQTSGADDAGDTSKSSNEDLSLSPELQAALAAYDVIDESSAPDSVKEVVHGMLAGITGEPTLTIKANGIENDDGQLIYQYDLCGHKTDGDLILMILVDKENAVRTVYLQSTNGKAPVLSAFNLAITLDIYDNFSTVDAVKQTSTNSSTSYYAYTEDGWRLMIFYNEDHGYWLCSCNNENVK